MTYEFMSCMAPFMTSFLEQQKLSVCKSCYDHRYGILRHLDRFLTENGYTDCNLSENAVFHWIATIERKPSTVISYVGTIRSFFKYVAGFGLAPFMPPYPKPHDDYIAYEFSDEELDRIFTVADNYIVTPISTRRYVYIQYELPMALRLLLGCGLRLEEASNLRLGDIDFLNGTLTIRKTKSNEYRMVPMDPTLSSVLAQYCFAFNLGTDRDAYIFPGEDFSRPIPSICFRRYFARILNKAGISTPGKRKYERGPCLHCLRHSFAHKSFKKGIKEGWAANDQIPWLSVYLGHKSLQETERYLNYDNEVFADEIAHFESYSADLFPEVDFDD